MSENVAEELAGELFDVHKALLNEAWVLWAKHRDLNKEIGPVKYSRLSIVTMTHMGAVTAVDVGMTEEQFLQTCKANYEEAARRAPRWA